MNYRDAVREAFVDLLGSWRLLPAAARELGNCLRAGVLALLSVVLLLLGPLLALLAPVMAFVWLYADREGKRSRTEAQRKIDEHYGWRHQRTQK